MPPPRVLLNAVETVTRCVDNYRWLEANDELHSRKHVDFTWTSPHGQDAREVKNCLFGVPLNRLEGNGGDWWSSADNDYSKELWTAAAAFSDKEKQQIINHVIGVMKTRNEKKMADDKKELMAAQKAAKKQKAAEEKEANDDKKRRKAAADEYRAQQAASEASHEQTDDCDSDDLTPLPQF